MTRKKYLWKSMKAGLKSNYDGSDWKVGEWRKEEPPIVECVGLNASKRIFDAMSYVNMEILAKVEVLGVIVKGADKWTCEKMRVVEAYVWPKEESVRLAIYAGELVIEIYEKENTADDRPRKAIEAAKAWLDNPNDQAAWTAAEAARTAAGAAAGAAAEAAEAAAEAAAWAAAGAAEAAAEAARAAARDDKILDKIEFYLLSRIEHLEKYSG